MYLIGYLNAFGWYFVDTAAVLCASLAVYHYRGDIEALYARFTGHGLTPASNVQGFVALPIVSIIGLIFRAVVGIGQATATAASATANITTAAIGIVPGVLAALGNPLVAAVMFGAVGLTYGYVHGHQTSKAEIAYERKTAVTAANAEADRAILAIKQSYDAKLKDATKACKK